MNQRDEDLIISSAFGEASPAEQLFVDSMVERDGEARKLHESMQSLRVDLKSLAEVPECQLSSEHLKSALLRASAKGPAPAPRISWVSAVGLSVAAAACAFILLRVPASQPAPATPQANLVARADPHPGTEHFVEILPGRLTSGEATVSPPVVLKEVRGAKLDRPVRHSHRRSSPVVDDSVLSAAAAGTLAAFVPGGVADSPSEPSPDAGAMIGMAPQPVVVVANAPDEDTGASSAEEVKKPGDVVFGG